MTQLVKLANNLFAFEQIISKFPTHLLLKYPIVRFLILKEYQDSALGYIFPGASPVHNTAMYKLQHGLKINVNNRGMKPNVEA